MKPPEDRIAAAYKFIRKRRLRDALDILNDAILADPYDPETFYVRAEVFEGLGLLPQAEADRQHALDLGWQPSPPPEALAAGKTARERPPQRAPELPPAPLPPREPAPPKPAAEPAPRLQPTGEPPPEPQPQARRPSPQPPPTPREEEPAEAPGTRLPVAVPRRASISLAGLLAYVPIGAALKLLAGAAVVAALVAALVLAAPWEGGSGNPGTLTPAPTTDGATPSAAATTAPAVTPGTNGSPYSSTEMIDAWKRARLSVQASALPGGLQGFAGAAVEATGSNAAGQISAYLLVYPTNDAALAEWNLTPGQTPSPKGGRTLPTHISIWWNQNIVVVVRSATGDTATVAFNALLGLAP